MNRLPTSWFHQIRVCCVTAPIRFCSAVHQTPLVAFWVCHGAVWLTAGVMRPRSSRNNHIITRDCSYRYMCYKNNNRKWSWLKDWKKSLWLSLFWDLCAGVNTEGYILKNIQMLYCCFDAWLPVCSVLNLAELLRRAPASARNRSPVYLCWKAPDCWSWDGADTQCTEPGGSWHID